MAAHRWDRTKESTEIRITGGDFWELHSAVVKFAAEYAGDDDRTRWTTEGNALILEADGADSRTGGHGSYLNEEPISER
ncbi:hypothetical protein SEA_CECE_278 [Microbacterium phage Cece]|nr:hypothetical protein SEA_CECE_278 [Microbacterium phage Cece]